MSDGTPRPTAREFRMLCEKLDRLDRKNDESHRVIYTKLDEVQKGQGQDRERLVAMEQGLGVLADLRERVKTLEGDVVDMQKETAVRKARLAGLGAIGGALVAALAEIVRGIFSRGGGP